MKDKPSERIRQEQDRELANMLDVLHETLSGRKKLRTLDDFPASVPRPMPAIGNCGKCGAPYFSAHNGPWYGVNPPPIQPSCHCWNNGTKTTNSTEDDAER